MDSGQLLLARGPYKRNGTRESPRSQVSMTMFVTVSYSGRDIRPSRLEHMTGVVFFMICDR